MTNIARLFKSPPLLLPPTDGDLIGCLVIYRFDGRPDAEVQHDHRK